MKNTILMVLLLGGCFMDNTTTLDTKKEDIKLSDIIYFGDPRTDQCFSHFYESAGANHKVSGIAYSAVPCTSKVCSLLVNRSDMKVCTEGK